MAKLIVGSSSYLAQALVRQLSLENENQKIFTTSRNTNFNSSYFLDLASPNPFPEFSLEITHAIIFAGLTSFDFCEKNKNLAAYVNYQKTCELIACLNSQNIRCLFVSSSAVFSESSFLHFENSPTAPSTVYGDFKNKTESQILRSSLNTVVRLTKVFSPSNSLLRQWINHCDNNHYIEAFDDLFVAPISEYSVVSWMVKWLSNPIAGIYHITSDCQISYYQFANKILRQVFDSKNLIKATSAEKSTNPILFRPDKANLDASSPYSFNLSLDHELDQIITAFFP